jgi:hypothetical protein
MGFFKWKLVAMSLMVALGGSLALFNPITWAFLQELAPGAIMARVLTAFSTAAMAASMLGMLLFGWAADVFTPATSLMGDKPDISFHGGSPYLLWPTLWVAPALQEVRTRSVI